MDWDVCNDDGVECPYCGEVYDDADTPHDSTVWECHECEREFVVEVEFSATYFSTKPESEVAAKEKSIEHWTKFGCDKDYAESIIARETKERDRFAQMAEKNKTKVTGN